MAIGKIVGLPPGSSQYARVRDEYGSEYSVKKEEIPKEARPGDDFAYRVDVFYNESGLATTLKNDDG